MKIKLFLLLLISNITFSQVVINEIDPDTPSTDQKEFIELIQRVTNLLYK